MEDNPRKNCKWMEYFENYDDHKCLCHLNVDSKYVEFEKDCKDCTFYEIDGEE